MSKVVNNKIQANSLADNKIQAKKPEDNLLKETIALDIGHLDMMLQLALAEDELEDE